MRVKKLYELAKEYDMKTNDMKALLTELGFPVKSNFTRITEEQQNAVLARLHQVEGKDEPVLWPEKTAVADVGPTDKVEEVIFFSPSRCHDIAYKKEVYFPGTPKIKDAAQSIRFDDYEYRTGDPEKIEFIKSTRSFKVRSTSYPKGKIRIVTEEELAKLKIARQPKVTEIKSTGDVDVSLHNPLPV